MNLEERIAKIELQIAVLMPLRAKLEESMLQFLAQMDKLELLIEHLQETRSKNEKAFEAMAEAFDRMHGSGGQNAD